MEPHLFLIFALLQAKYEYLTIPIMSFIPVQDVWFCVHKDGNEVRIFLSNEVFQNYPYIKIDSFLLRCNKA